MNQKTEIELLSPAKNLEFGKIAINFGADAVYIGAPFLNARLNASNSIVDIEKLCQYAHSYHSRVYVAMNTIIYDSELEQAQKTIKQLYEAGADALIIQDFGILEMQLPPIPLHASTQTNNISLEHIRFLEKVGFSRVVLARELDLYQILQIRQHTNIELEAFVHGAVCVSYSGQCYMSYFLGNRSGNRGQCAQPCRLKYNLWDANQNTIISNSNLLSLKDINRADLLQNMIEAGVNSLKIEGRLKDLNYVKNITAFYRKKIDDIIEKNSNFFHPSIGEFVFEFEPNPQKTFNRGFTDYFLTGRTPQMKAISPKSIGEKIGRVLFAKYNQIKIDTNIKINNGDGLCFVDSNGDTIGFRVNKYQKGIIYTLEPIEITVGTDIYRNFDFLFNSILEKIDNCRFIKVNLTFSQTANGFCLKAQTTDKKFEAEIDANFQKQIAQNEQKAKETLETNLRKTGDTSFIVHNLEVQTSKTYFLPISFVNKIRRDVLNLLFEKIQNSYHPKTNVIEPNNCSYPKQQANYQFNISNKLAQKFYERHNVKVVEKALEITENKTSKTLMTTKYCLKYELQQCPKHHKTTSKEKMPRYLELNNKKFELQFDCNNCQMKIFLK